MFPASDNPGQFGDSGGSDGGTDTAVLYVTPEVVPVRLVFSGPLPVQVTNFPGQPPPLPGGGLRVPGQPPPLPTPTKAIVPKEEGGLTAEKLGFGELMKLGTVAGATAAGIGLIAKGFDQLRATFIEPLLGKAAGGLHEGIERGAGVEAVGKSFTLLGVTIGVQLLPVTIRLAASALVLAENFEELNNNPIWSGLLLGNRGELPGSGLTGIAGLDKTIGGLAGLIGGTKGRGIGAGAAEGIVRGAGGRDLGNAMGNDEQFKKAMAEVVDDLRRGLGSKAGFVGVADIRGQAQMAALQDPLEAKMRNLQIQALEKFLGGKATVTPEMAREMFDRFLHIFPFGGES